MEYRNLELTLVSAEGLKDINLVGKMDLYAVAYLVGNPKTKQKTGVDKNCGTTPRWNHKMKFTLDERSISSPPGLTLFVQIMAEKFGPDKDVGEVSLNILELFESAKSTNKEGEEGGENEKVIADYQIKGKGKGTLKISYTFGEIFSQDVKSKKIDEPAIAYPPGGGYGQAGSSMPPQHMGYPPNQGYPMGGIPSGYPPSQGYPIGGPPPPQPGYPNQPPQGYPGYGAPPPHGYGAPPPHGYGGGYYPAPGGYGPPPQQPYGYADHNQHAKQKKKKSGMGGMGMGIGAGLLGGLLIGDMIGDVGEAAAYADGYGDAMGDVGGGFDF
ncbi:hypothetical protein LIER_34031 [Lithospermum erythrorhizon]|uniref:C2 domain-containing protein n=1 Tax=Lithospermum erythrorhizon TaxID=34254 RepID=A0AAV3S084_LITER